MYMATTHTQTCRPVNMVSRIFSHYFSAQPRAEPHRQPRQQVMASTGAKPGKIAYWGAEVGLATRGAAGALYLEGIIGSIAPGYEADLFVLDTHSTELIDYRMRR